MNRFVLAVLVVALPLSAQTTPVEEGRAALDRNDPQAAVNLLESAVEQSPQNANAHYFLGVAYGKLAERASIFRQPGLARRTRDEFERAVSLDPNHIDARSALVEYYTMAPSRFGGNEQRARQQAAEIAGRDAGAGHRAWAFIDVHDRDYKAAADELDAAVQLDESDMVSWFEIGHVAALSGVDLPRGEAALQRYLGHTPKGDEPPLDRAFYWLGKIYEREGRKAEAEKAYAKAATLRSAASSTMR